MRTQVLLDHLAAIADAEHHVGKALAAKLLELMIYERSPGHRHERLRDCLGDRSQPCGEPTRQDNHRKAHVNRTLVPSKSKRKRTPCRPALAMAWRRRLRSEA